MIRFLFIALAVVLVAVSAFADPSDCLESLPVASAQWYLVTLPCDVGVVNRHQNVATGYGPVMSSSVNSTGVPTPLPANPTVKWQVLQDAADSSSYTVELLGPSAGSVTLHTNGSADPGQAIVLASFFATEGVGNYSLQVTFVSGAGSQVNLLKWWIEFPVDPTIAAQFGDDFGVGTYGSDWGFFEWNPFTASYSLMPSGNPLYPGVGYWFKSLSGGALTVVGRKTSWNPIQQASMSFTIPGLPVTGSPPTPVMVGYPYQTFGPLNWNQVRINGSFDPGAAETNGWVSKNMYKWSGAAYTTYDGSLPGAASGDLYSWDGFFVKTLTGGNSMNFPDQCGCCACAIGENAPAPTTHPVHFAADEWSVNLIASAGSLRDDHNPVGRLSDAALGFDRHDTDEPTPQLQPYLTIVFSHPEWVSAGAASDFNGDYRGLGPCRGGSWPFEVRSSQSGISVTIAWENIANADDLVARGRVRDAETGAILASGKDGRATFVTSSVPKRLLWESGADLTGCRAKPEVTK